MKFVFLVVHWTWLFVETFHFSFRASYRDYVTPGACARWWEALWNRWPNFFKYRWRVQEAVFICLNRVHLRKVSWMFYLQTFFSNNRSCLLRYFWKLLQWRKSKNPATSCMQISLSRTLLRMCPSWHSPFKVHLTPNFFFAQINFHIMLSKSPQKFFDLLESSIFYLWSKYGKFNKNAAILVHVRVLGAWD